MNETWQNQPPAPPAAGWARRIRRSGTDRKIAGVAGGLGRALGIDPLILRVAFVVLAVFGGSGVLLYALSWLLLPADGDEVSAAEALLGRGRSSVSPALTVILAIVVLGGLASMFSWGLPFWPLLIAGIIVVAVMRRRGGGPFGAGYRRGPGFCGGRMQERAERHARRWGEHADRWADQASRWGDHVEQWVNRQTWSGGGAGSTTSSSPFDRPAFWDEPASATPTGPDLTKPAGAAGQTGASRPTQAQGPDLTKTGPDLTKHAPQDAGPQPAGAWAPQDQPVGFADPLAEPTRTPPAWDPLGVAPFAWDLPDPSPVPPPAPVQQRRSGGPIARVTLGLALLAGGLATAGIFAGWWSLNWGQVSAIALAVVALGLLVSALRGRGLALIGPGIFLTLVTLALGFTGLHGTHGFGATHWEPTSVSQLAEPFEINAGYGNVDLTGLNVPAGQTVSAEVILRAGRAEVELPENTAVTVTCDVDAGQVDCLGQNLTGADRSVTTTQPGDAKHGTINLHVQVRAGSAEVTHG